MSNPNYFFVRKQDFNSPNTYNLNIMKPYPRSRIRAFVPKEAAKNEEQRKLVVNQIKSKFLSRDPVSSQIAKQKPNRIINETNLYHTCTTDLYNKKFQQQFEIKDQDTVWEKVHNYKRPKYTKMD